MLADAEASFVQPDATPRVRPCGVLDRPLDRHDRIGALGQRSAGHDPGARTGTDHDPRHVARGEVDRDLQFHDPVSHGREVGVPNREAVHHRPIPWRGIDVGHDGRPENGPAGLEKPAPSRRKG